jgi:hypothetical protein
VSSGGVAVFIDHSAENADPLDSPFHPARHRSSRNPPAGSNAALKFDKRPQYVALIENSLLDIGLFAIEGVWS